MRLPAFLFAMCLAALVAFGSAVSSQKLTNVSQAVTPPRGPVSDMQRNYESSRMWRRAEFRVMPLEQVDRNRAALESLRNRVVQAARQDAGWWLVDPNVRQQLSSQIQLMKDLLAFVEQQQSDQGKSPNALAVERRLNQMQGQTMCEACHGGIVAQNHGGRTSAAR